MKNSEEFLTGKRVIRSEQKIEDEIRALTDLLLDSDPIISNRTSNMYESLGTALSLIGQVASCAWGCRGKDHIIENLLRRFCNCAFASLRLMACGLYDEALGPARSMAEIVNLLQVFCIDKKHLEEWKQILPKQRLKKFSPVKVRLAIEKHGQIPLISKDIYSKLCENGIHVSPDAIHISHEYENRLYVGGHFALPGFLLILTRLSSTVAPCLVLAGHLVGAPNEKMKILWHEAKTLLDSRYGIDVTEYEIFVEKFRAEHTHARVLEKLSTIDKQTWRDFINKLIPELTETGVISDIDKMTTEELQNKVYPIIYNKLAADDTATLNGGDTVI